MEPTTAIVVMLGDFPKFVADSLELARKLATDDMVAYGYDFPTSADGLAVFDDCDRCDAVDIGRHRYTYRLVYTLSYSK